jgi:hypothetical protein
MELRATERVKKTGGNVESPFIPASALAEEWLHSTMEIGKISAQGKAAGMRGDDEVRRRYLGK